MPRRPKEQDEDRDRRRLAVAVLAVERELPQREIAEVLGISQAEVSRLYREACDDKWVVTKLELPPEYDASMVETKTFAERVKLQRIFEHLSQRDPDAATTPFQRLHILYGGSFYRKAGSLVADLARSAEYVGVAWGRNVKDVIDAIPRQHSSRVNTVFPVAGVPVAKPVEGLDANAATQRFGDLFRAKNVLELLAIPARVPTPPDGMSLERVTEAARSYVYTNHSYTRIFGPGNQQDTAAVPLVAKVDMVLTGVGGAADDQDTVVNDAALVEPALREVAAGNIAGCWLPRHGSTVSERDVVKRVNEEWFGIDLESLRSCVDRASDGGSKRPGVVVVAKQTEKAEAIVEAIKEGVVSHLIISKELSEALLKLERRQRSV